ncbi:transport-associated ob type 1 [Lucifera butyrica]|uniref:Transport-associated ob type 1 n=1 Tax=Lucifera butyrica TaxID=1351585 RepID=A0A498R4I7_9FIRM|nr:sn-glycerol-3-phosphate ABC transporter ATP-binding protein UgpC [Lucifera butyrica]VBB05720.1 transport-associated ob type 1 [Lucifera butyrica]
MASVVLKNIYKRYENHVDAVKDFNLLIQDGEMVVFVGPSGCGKSTTLRMIAGLEEISSGELYIGEKRVNQLSPKERDIAMVFQNYALYPHMSVYENMAFSLKLKKVPKDEIDKKVKEAAQVLQIEHLLDRKPKALSGGQRQRVAMGRAIVRKPAVFLMDEPLSNLDAKLRVSMRAEISRLHRQLKTTTIYVTHDQTEAMTLGDRIVVMKDGMIQQVDTPMNLYSSPVNSFVAGFIGNPAMNFLEAVIQKEENDLYMAGNGFNVLIPGGKAAALLEYCGRKVVLGIRPEDIRDEAIMLQTFPQARVEAKVDVVEQLGPEVILYLTVGGQEIISRIAARNQYRQGDRVTMVFDMNKMHVFDPATGLSCFRKG